MEPNYVPEPGNPFQAELQRMFGIIEKTVDGAERIANLVEDKQLQTSLLSALKKLSEIDQSLDIDLKAIEEVNRAGPYADDQEILAKKFAELRPKIDKTNAGRWRQKIDDVRSRIQKKTNERSKGNDDGADMEMISCTYSSKDPITKSDIQDPVKNSECGHVYDRNSVKNFIADCKARKQLCQCPVRSCPNKKPLNMENMVHFPEFFNQISK